MQAAAFSALVLPEVIGCPVPLLLQRVMLVANQFCAESGVWDEVQASTPTLDGVVDYEISAPADADVVRVRSAWVDNIPLTPERLSRPSPDGMTPTGYHQAKGANVLTLTQKPVAGQSLVARVVYAPKITSRVLPDFLMTSHQEAISSGVKGRLMAMSGQMWSNVALAQMYLGQFAAAIVDARIASERDNVGGSLRVPSRRFGN